MSDRFVSSIAAWIVCAHIIYLDNAYPAVIGARKLPP
jgi:hypothetical protein